MTEQPTGVLRFRDPSSGEYVPLAFPPHEHPGGSATRIPGEVIMWAGQDPPPGWLWCDGSDVSAATYPELAAVLGTLWGSPGAGLVRLPNFRGRSPLGAGGALYPDAGTALGAATHTHTADPLPSHTHYIAPVNTTTVDHAHSVNPPATTSSSAGAHTHTTGTPQGGAADHADGTEASAAYAHTHAVNSGGGHTHSVDVPSFTSGSNSHAHSVNPSAAAGGAVTPTLQSGSSYHPSLVVGFVIYAG